VKKQYTLAELAQYLDAQLIGEPDCLIDGLETLTRAGAGQLSFLANAGYAKYLADCSASAVILHPDQQERFAGNKLLVPEPYLSYARVTELFDPRPRLEVGCHPSAVVADDCRLGARVCIGANAVISEGVTLGDGVEVGAGCFIGAGTAIGANTYLAANVSIYHGVIIGPNCIIHSNAVIGSDGFGFAPAEGRWQKVHQLGGVRIGAQVEIGAGTAIDRGALEDTVIGDGVKIDNQVHIAHNVRIGKNTAIAANSAIAGSASLGENCTVAGCVGIAGHVTIVDRVHLSGMSMVTNSISEPGSYSSGIPLSPSAEWRKNAVRFKQLNSLTARVKQLEKDKDKD
jgi:UDP-3-O-[3-hydroxymyristoyl] glucosamine N-acyltransferase